MKRRTLFSIVFMIAGTVATASAQSPAAPAAQGLAPVTITAPRPGTVYRIAHIDEQRQYVLGLLAENRRLAADLRRTDRKVEQLEDRLDMAKADRDRRVAGIAAVDSAAAETRRMRLELEEKLRRLEPVAVTERNGTGSR